MYVVRIENDEAVMYRAFRHIQRAKAWAAERNAESLECLVDISEAPETDDHRVAVVRAKTGNTVPVMRGEALPIAPAFIHAAADIQFRRDRRA